MNRNNFMDQQHLMALPYVDFFLTDDTNLRAMIGRISPGLPFPIATPADESGLRCSLFGVSSCYVCCVAPQDLSVFFTAGSLMILRNPANCFRYSDFVTADN